MPPENIIPFQNLKRSHHAAFVKPEALVQIKNSQLQLSFVRCKQLPLDFRAEISATVARMSHQNNQEWGLCFRARACEKLLLEVLWQMRKKFSCYILRMKNEKNLIEVSEAVLFCKERNIPYEFIDIDLKKVLEKEHFAQFAFQFYAYDLDQALDLVLFSEALKKNKFIVLGAQFPQVIKNQNGWMVQNSIESWASYFYAYQQNKNCCAQFYKWNSNLYFAFLNTRFVRNLVMNAMPDCHSFSSVEDHFLKEWASNLNSIKVQDDIEFEKKIFAKQITAMGKAKVTSQLQTFGEVFNSLRPLQVQTKV